MTRHRPYVEMTTAQFNEMQRRSMTEAVWQGQAEAILRGHGWTVKHIEQSTRGTNRITGDAGSAGLPDIIAWTGGQAIVMLELKRHAATAHAESKQVRPKQREVLDELAEIAQYAAPTRLTFLAGVLRPMDIDLLYRIAESPWAVNQSELPQS